ALVQDEVYVSRATAEEPKVPSYEGGRFPLSTYLADRVRNIIAHPQEWRPLPAQVREWLEIQDWRARAPPPPGPLGHGLPRAPTSITSSAIRSRGALRTRRSACCSRAGSNALACARLASSPTNTRSRSTRTATSRFASSAASSRLRRCSMRTCWATILKRGS